MKKNKCAAVLYGKVPPNARPDDQDTLHEVGAVKAALKELGYAPTAVPLGLNGKTAVLRLQSLQPAFVFNLVESVETQSRLIALGPLLLDQLGLPYTGCQSDAVYTTSTKTYTKKVLSMAALPTPGWQGAEDALRRCRLKPPFILKPKWEHASVGLDESSILKNGGELARKLKGKCTRDYFIEDFIEGREFNVSVWGRGADPSVLPIAEIDFSEFEEGRPRIVGYKAKWEKDSFEYNHTPRRFDFDKKDRELLRQLKALSLRCWKVFCLSGYARVDFRVDRRNRPFILEVNANPCISPDAGFAAAAARAGFSYGGLIEQIVRFAM